MKVLLGVISFFLLSSCSVFELEPKKNKVQNVKVISNTHNVNLFSLRNKLDTYFNEDLNSSEIEYKYRLEIGLRKAVSLSGIGSDAFSSTSEAQLTIFYSLIDIETGKVLLKSSISKTTNYISSKTSPLSEYIAEKQTSQEVADGSAREIYEEVQNYLNEQKP